nr:hypothetical protein CFP56_62408 [Quercus suber]
MFGVFSATISFQQLSATITWINTGLEDKCSEMFVRIRGVQKALAELATWHMLFIELVGKVLQTLHTLDLKTFFVAIWIVSFGIVIRDSNRAAMVLAETSLLSG